MSLAAYIFRVAITNNRIEKDEGGEVTYRYKDGKTGRWQHRTVPAGEFIRLFLQHVLPFKSLVPSHAAQFNTGLHDAPLHANP